MSWVCVSTKAVEARQFLSILTCVSPPHDPVRNKKKNVLSRCTMMLGMLSWTMATTQDYRSGFQKKKDGNKPRDI